MMKSLKRSLGELQNQMNGRQQNLTFSEGLHSSVSYICLHSSILYICLHSMKLKLCQRAVLFLNIFYLFHIINYLCFNFVKRY